MWFRVGGAERRALWGEGNRRALREIVDSGPTPGLVAYRDGEPIGWCSVAPRSEFPVLARSPVARPIDDAPVWSLVCLYVVPEGRGLGVARQLVRAACAHAAEGGAETVEAYPVDDTMGPVAPDTAYHGVVTLLRSEGFAEVARRAPRRPLMRRDVRGLHSGAWTPAPE